MAITEDDFLRWRDNAVTQWIFKALETAVQAQKDEWGSISWDGNAPDPLKLMELRTRADSYAALFETDFTAWQAINGETPLEEAA